jgi:hypothetical protein
MLLALLFVVPATAHGALLFDGPAWQVGQASFTRSTSIADLNGDGANDLVLALADGGLAVALGAGNGSFGPFVTSPGPDDLYGRIADVDGDGLPDFVGTGFTYFGPDTSVVFVAFGNGNAGWSATFQVGTAAIAQENAVGDLDGDGRADLVVALSDTTVAVYRANANRTMTLVGVYDTPGVAGGMALGDVAGSSAPDLIVSYVDGFVGASTFEGNGDGTLGPRTDTSMSDSGVLAALGTIDGQPGLDLLLGFSGIFLAPGLGGGAFGASASLPGVPGISRGLIVRDFDGDGDDDVAGVSGTNADRGLVTWRNDGAGVLTRVQAGAQSNGIPGALYAGDVDGDLRVDLAYPASFSSVLYMSSSQGDGTFGEPQLPAASGRFQGLAVGDFDEDGKLDAVVGDTNGGGRLGFAHGAGNGRLNPIAFTAATFPNGKFLVTGRFDADAHLDLVGLASTATASFYRGHGDGTFDAAINFSLGASPGSSVVAADVDGDGDLDVAIPCEGSNQIAVLKQGAGGLAAPVFSPTAAGPVVVRYADLNGDTRPDRVLAATNQWIVELDNGAGGYSLLESHAQSPRPDDFALADFDGDGRLDIALTPGFSGSTYLAAGIHVWRGQPGGGFANETIADLNWVADPTAQQIGAFGILAKDLDGDGDADLVTRGGNSFGGLVAARGRGDGTFEDPEGYATPYTGKPGLEAADLDGDGFLDLVGISASNSPSAVLSALTTYHNRSAGVVGTPSRTSHDVALAITRLAPNPSRGAFALALEAAAAGTVRVSVVSLSGRVVHEQDLPIASGPNRVAIAPGPIRPGVYWVRVTDGVRAANRKFVMLP